MKAPSAYSTSASLLLNITEGIAKSLWASIWTNIAPLTLLFSQILYALPCSDITSSFIGLEDFSDNSLDNLIASGLRVTSSSTDCGWWLTLAFRVDAGASFGLLVESVTLYILSMAGIFSSVFLIGLEEELVKSSFSINLYRAATSWHKERPAPGWNRSLCFLYIP